MSEENLNGGRVTKGVVRIGDTVRRPQCQNAEFVHQLLKYLESVGFKGSPRFLGIDEQGREILSYIEGDVPSDLSAWTEVQLVTASQLIKRFHDATTGSTLVDGYEVVCHNDLSPCNVVMRDGLSVVLIDFDTADKGSRISDLAYAVWMWCCLGEDEFSPTEQARKIKLMCDSYGLKNRKDFILEIMKRQQKNVDSCKRNIKQGLPGPGIEAVVWGEKCLKWVIKYKTELNNL